jgi:SP family arabinose:H+ symporter-like MFS transporter
MVSLVAATSGLLFGFDIAVINGALLFLREHFALGEWETEMAASSLLAGCVLGASQAGWLSDRYGRRRILIVSAVLFAVSSVGAALPRTLWEFVLARFAGGLAIGAASLLAPMYIAEVAPHAIRGRLVALNQMAIVTGILLAYLANWALSFLGAGSWRWMFAVAAVPSIAFFIALFFVPESPRWLLQRGFDEPATKILVRVNGAEEAARERGAILEAIGEESGGWRELLEPGNRKALTVGIMLAVLQQITGINTVLFYGSVIFREFTGESDATTAIAANVWIGLVNFFATIAAVWAIDRIGRQPLLRVSAALMAVGHLGMAACYVVTPPPAVPVLMAMLLCVASFAIGLGPGVWVVISEIFPNRVRGRAMSIATVSLWIACVVLTFTFLTLVRLVTISGAFALYGVVCLFTAWFVHHRVPETKGRPLEEIAHFWRTK